MKKLSNLVLIFIFSSSFFFPQDSKTKIRIPIWAELDAYPGLEEAQDTTQGQFDYPIKRLKETSKFLLNGMIYGWTFEYTPSDKLRNVSEYFNVKEINSIVPIEEITYKKPWIENNKLYCWIEYTRTPQMIWNLKTWESITTKKIQGRGKGKISNGFDGIIEASNDALKNAIREYYRSYIKNKPKEIDGKVIIRKTPEFGINSGHYIVELDFFLETDRILEYTQF